MSIHIAPRYPTPQHEQAAHAVVDLFSSRSEPQAVILTCSCARGKASRDSCLDSAILLPLDLAPSSRMELEQTWQRYDEQAQVFRSLRAVGAYSNVDLEFTDGVFVPQA